VLARVTSLSLLRRLLFGFPSITAPSSIARAADNYLDCVGDAFDRACERRVRSAVRAALPFPRDWNEALRESLSSADPSWTEAVGEAGLLLVRWSSVALVRPGMTLRTEEAERRPESYFWDADPDSLYALLHLDAGIAEGKQHSNFLAFNIPGNDVTAGDVAFTYLPPFR